MKNNKKSNIAAQLTCAALALPGLMQTASAGRVEETYNADFQYGHYEESNQRMRVDIFQGALSAPIGKSMTANVSILRDTIAGASPQFNKKDAQGNITHSMSSASPTNWCGESICEQRDAANAGLTYFFDKASLNLGGGFSREQDYTARYFNTALSLDLNKKLTTLNFGASVSFDEVSPSVTNLACGDNKCSKTGQQYLLGVSQVIDKDSLLQSNITFGYHTGYMTDPYKRVGVTGDVDLGGGLILPGFSTDIHEKRPEERFEWAWLTQYVRHFEQFNHAALHADYRFSTNDWGVNAHTLELSWHQPIAEGWQVIPRFRYYSQDKADFYQPYFNANVVIDPNIPGEQVIQNAAAYSSDYRLAGFGTFSGGLKLSKEFTELKPLSQLKFQTGFEYYSHKAEYQLGGNNLGTFDNFGYYLVTASFNLKF